MSRYYAPISLEAFKSKLQVMFHGDDFLSNIPKTVDKDIAKVNFDWENWEVGVKPVFDENQKCIGLDDYPNQGFMKYPCGIFVLPNGMPAFFVNAGGDWETPVCFAMYWDGKGLRGYIPKDGNHWNRKNKEAFGNDEESDYDVENVKSFIEESKKWLSEPEYAKILEKFEKSKNDLYEFCQRLDLSSKDAIFKDLMERITLKK